MMFGPLRNQPIPRAFRVVADLACLVLAAATHPALSAEDGAAPPDGWRLGGSLASTWEFGLYSLPYWVTAGMDLHAAAEKWQGSASLRFMIPANIFQPDMQPLPFLCLEILPLGFRLSPWEPRIGRGLAISWEPRAGGGLMLDTLIVAYPGYVRTLAAQAIIDSLRLVFRPADEAAPVLDLSCFASPCAGT